MLRNHILIKTGSLFLNWVITFLVFSRQTNQTLTFQPFFIVVFFSSSEIHFVCHFELTKEWAGDDENWPLGEILYETSVHISKTIKLVEIKKNTFDQTCPLFYQRKIIQPFPLLTLIGCRK